MTNTFKCVWVHKGKRNLDVTPPTWSVQRYKPSTLAYLNIGTGNACASQRNPKPLPVSTSKEFDFEVLGTFGAALPTGSACNRTD
jgi:hypothetical protein